MPLFPGGPKVGLGLWNSVPGTLALELPMFGAGVGNYLSTTRARTVFGRWGLSGRVLILVTICLANLAGTPPAGRSWR